MTDEKPEQISLQDLYASVEAVVDATDFDVEAGLAKVHRKIDDGGEMWKPLLPGEVDGNGRWICPHCNDIYGPADAEDGDVPPVCSMCKKAQRT